MNDWKERLTKGLEPLLLQVDPRPKISAYHNMPYAVFCYPPEDEFALRGEVTMLITRLKNAGKRVISISLAECMGKALEAEELTIESLAEAEKDAGLDAAVETIHEILSTYQPLDEIVASHLPKEQDPERDIVFIMRAGSLFPLYRTSSLLEQLQGRVHVPGILFYPGELDGPAGLRFMGILDAEHNYRTKIF